MLAILCSPPVSVELSSLKSHSPPVLQYNSSLHAVFSVCEAILSVILLNMAKIKCCVFDCDSTSNTHVLFCMPKNNNLRILWMSMLVSTSPYLFCLNENQLLRKRICKRVKCKKYDYPCLVACLVFLTVEIKLPSSFQCPYFF